MTKRFTTDLKPQQTIQVGDAKITLEHKSGRLARLVIEADESIKIIPPARRSVPPTEELEATHG